ncbi:uncharacterized protein OCT59_024983 [Rhizophagus irregularis]|uniref:uncharacterized protein n=1 Tax=Rhizophagus irregularis TaxID=588596 RepID=UPI000CB878C5|nr:hypothetical protein OCT59_024983 [Rhizophagus irregularis]
MSSAKLREIPLEETIRKVLHMAATEAKIVSQNDVSSSSKDSDEFSLEEESLDDPMEIDFVKKKEPKTSVATVKCISTVPVESVGVVRNLPITLAPGLTIHEDFVVMRYKKPTLIFSNQLLKKYRCAVDWATNELKIPLNGKDYIIPVTMHKIKNKLEVNCVRTTPECDDLPAPDKISQDLDADVTLKKK